LGKQSSYAAQWKVNVGVRIRPPSKKQRDKTLGKGRRKPKKSPRAGKTSNSKRKGGRGPRCHPVHLRDRETTRQGDLGAERGRKWAKRLDEDRAELGGWGGLWGVLTKKMLGGRDWKGGAEVERIVWGGKVGVLRCRRGGKLKDCGGQGVRRGSLWGGERAGVEEETSPRGGGPSTYIIPEKKGDKQSEGKCCIRLKRKRLCRKKSVRKGRGCERETGRPHL